MLINHYPPHKYLNSTKCVIQSRELNNMEESEIAMELRLQGVLAIEIISVKYDFYALTINGQTIPEHINTGIWKLPFDIYSKPSKMFTMPKIRSYQKFMQGKSCLQWMWQRRAYFRWLHKWTKMCQLWKRPLCHIKRLSKMGKEMIKLKYTEKISLTNARKRLQPPSSDPCKNSYATITTLLSNLQDLSNPGPETFDLQLMLTLKCSSWSTFWITA